MSSVDVAPSRLLAYQALVQAHQSNRFVRDVLDELIAADVQHQILEADRGYARVLALGVTAAYGVLDPMLRELTHGGLKAKWQVRTALMIALYELMLLNKEAYAVVSQGVNLARHADRRAGRFANALLRKAADGREDWSRQASVGERFGICQSMEGLLMRSLDQKDAHAVMQAQQAPAPLYGYPLGQTVLPRDARPQDSLVRPDGLSIPPQSARAYLGHMHTYHLTSRSILSAVSDELIVSDAAAQAVAQSTACLIFHALLTKPHQIIRVVEFGSGRGTKTALIAALLTHLAREYNVLDELSRLAYLAVEPHEQRMSASQHRFANIQSHLGYRPWFMQGSAQMAAAYLLGKDKSEALQHRITRIAAYPTDDLNVCDWPVHPANNHPRSIHLVIVDAPCSGTGTMRRHPEIVSAGYHPDPHQVYSWDQRLHELTTMQSEMVGEAMRLMPEMVLYATCSVLPQENEQLCLNHLLVDEAAHYQPCDTPCVHTKPVLMGCDGHYARLFVRQ